MRISTVASELAWFRHSWIWFDYPSMLSNLGFNDKTAGCMVAEAHMRMARWTEGAREDFYAGLAKQSIESRA